jgi:hypothetical protein
MTAWAATLIGVYVSLSDHALEGANLSLVDDRFVMVVPLATVATLVSIEQFQQVHRDFFQKASQANIPVLLFWGHAFDPIQSLVRDFMYILTDFLCDILGQDTMIRVSE